MICVKAYSARWSWMRSALEPWIGSMGWHLTQNRRVPWANLFVVHGSNLFHCQSVWSWPTMNGTRFEWHVVQFMGTGFSDSMNAQTNIKRALSFDAGGIYEVCSWFTRSRLTRWLTCLHWWLEKGWDRDTRYDLRVRTRDWSYRSNLRFEAKLIQAVGWDDKGEKYLWFPREDDMIIDKVRYVNVACCRID